jgi:hypothetical protein
MMHIMRGLHRAHRQTDREGRALNLIHRDVSPSNVICSYAGEVKLCDFGIAKATLSTVQTRSGVIKGKVKYMSPEQALGRKLDPRTDIFSGGSVLYELLTRVPPFLAPNEMELLVLVRETRYTPVRERNPMIPPALEAIVDTAMSQKPEDRYQTGDDFANALHNFLVVHAPDLTRSHLGRFVRQLFADDIEKELRALEEYVVESADNEEVGVNLIADALGPNADFSKFSPMPSGGAELEQLQASRDGVLETRSGAGAAVRDPALSAEPTVILEGSDLVQRLESTDAERLAPATDVLWQAGDGLGEAPGLQRSATEKTLLQAEGLHTAHTVILDLPQELSEQPAPDGAGQRHLRRVVPDTAEMHAVAASPAVGDADLSGKSDADTPLTPVSFHELPTGQIEETGDSSPPSLMDAETAELEASGLVSDAEVERAAPAPAPHRQRLSPIIHTETTELLEVDDLDPEGEAHEEKPGQPPRPG